MKTTQERKIINTSATITQSKGGEVRMTSHVRKIFAALLSGVVVAGAVAVVPSAAKASAYGYDYWGTHTFKDIPIPRGQLFGAVEGSGLRVDRAGGTFIAAGNLCNWHIDVDFYDRSQTRYYHVQGQNNSGCSRIGGEKYNLNGFRARPGRACIRLYRDFGNEGLASVCHGIH